MANPANALEQHHAVEVEREGMYIHLGRRRIRLEYLLLIVMVLVAVTLAALFFALELGADDVERWGYAGLFGVVLLRSASVVLPMPGGGVILAAGGLLDSAWGIPAPLLVGVVAGFAESLGEFTGYGAGLGGSKMLDKRPMYHRVKRWVQRRAFLTVFAMSFTPASRGCGTPGGTRSRRWPPPVCALSRRTCAATARRTSPTRWRSTTSSSWP